MGAIEVTTTLEPRGNASAIVLTDEQVAEVGQGPKRFRVVVTIGGESARLAVARMGGESLVGFSRAARTQLGLEIGDEVHARIALDTAPREVEVPPALTAALDGDSVARERYDALAYTHRKEFARWIAEAKKDETRDRRVAQALEMLHAGKTRS